MKNLMKKIRTKVEKIRIFLERNLIIRNIVFSTIIFFIIVLQCYQLQFSAIANPYRLFSRGILLNAVNVGLTALPTLMLALLIRNWTITLSITNVFYCLWSIANYYVIEFHGSPLFFSELANAGTAAEVIGGYKLVLDKLVFYIICFSICEICGIFILWFFSNKTKAEKTTTVFAKRLIKRFLITGVDGLLIFLCLFSSYSIKPKHTIAWHWLPAVQNYGFLCCVVEDLDKMLNPFIVPEGYDVNAIQVKVNNENISRPEQYPDIILILNESFCDLDYYTDINADSDYLAPFYQLENAVYGFVPSGGGTNNAEYELLTSNSMSLLGNPAPFNYVDMANPGNHLVSYLERLNYRTWGMHCGSKSNYSRNNAYPAIGFDHIMLGSSDFSYYTSYGNRPWLDSDNYSDLIEEYEADDGKCPRFMYLLTMQNHGGYEQNDDSYDLVHTTLDLGDLTDDVNEYLTSVSFTAEAFQELTNYFSKVERPVIICMVGDHPPAFISDLPAKEGMSEDEVELARQMVPYVIWANYEVDFPEVTDYASFMDLGPMLLEIGGLPLSPYYQTILDLHNLVPARTRSDIFMDANGKIDHYSPESPYYEMFTQYYYLEYNSLIGGKDYIPQYFQPPLSGKTSRLSKY